MGLNFLTQTVIAYYFGTDLQRDAYFSALTIPAYLIILFSGSISTIFLPYYVDFRKNNSKEDVVKFGSSMLGCSIIFLLVVCAIGFISSRQIVDWIAPGFSLQQKVLTREIFDILIFTVIFQALSSVVIVFHHVDSKFLRPALSPLIIPITSFVAVLFFHKHGIIALAFGAQIGSFLSLVILITALADKVKFRDLIGLINPATKKVIILSMPLLISGSIYRLTTVIERIIGSTLPNGSISALGYSNQIYVLLVTIATGSIATTFFPKMAHSWSGGMSDEFNKIACRAIKLILAITLPIAAIFFTLGQPIIMILFQRGAFDSAATISVAESLKLFLGAFIFSGLGSVIGKIFYITNRTMAVSIVSIVEIFVYAICAYFLSHYYSYLGLAFSLTISTGFNIFVMTYLLIRWKYVLFSDLLGDTLKLVGAALICGMLIKSIFLWTESLNIFFGLMLSGLFGLSGYLFCILYVFKISEADTINKLIKSYF
ncbi:MAG: polysaccharide biosynthesis C-terminal domain-containing protein [Bacteroidia bacterium]|nr:polysaccharide biosynthesis C-terminal domain-containing protein [Bacteroidia bacterium]